MAGDISEKELRLLLDDPWGYLPVVLRRPPDVPITHQSFRCLVAPLVDHFLGLFRGDTQDVRVAENVSVRIGVPGNPLLGSRPVLSDRPDIRGIVVPAVREFVAVLIGQIEMPLSYFLRSRNDSICKEAAEALPFLRVFL